MSDIASVRQPFVAAIADRLRTEEGGEGPDGGESGFYRVKQALLDEHELGSDAALAIASIGWDEIEPLLHQ